MHGSREPQQVAGDTPATSCKQPIADVPCPQRLSFWVDGAWDCENGTGVNKEDIHIVVVVSIDVD